VRRPRDRTTRDWGGKRGEEEDRSGVAVGVGGNLVRGEEMLVGVKALKV
jgi:hypothetical protein